MLSCDHSPFGQRSAFNFPKTLYVIIFFTLTLTKQITILNVQVKKLSYGKPAFCFR